MTSATNLLGSIRSFQESREVKEQTFATVAGRRTTFSRILSLDLRDRFELEEQRLSFVFEILNPILNDAVAISKTVDNQNPSPTRDIVIREEDGNSYTGKFVLDVLRSAQRAAADPGEEQDTSLVRHHALQDPYFSSLYSLFPDNGPSSLGRTSLFAAAEGGNVEIFEQLLATSEAENINTEYKSGHTPFHVAVLRGHTGIVKSLANTKVIKDTRDIAQNTVVHTAARYGKIDVLEYFLTNPEFIDLAKSTKYGWETPFYTACIHGEFEAANLLLNHLGPDVVQANIINFAATRIKDQNKTLKYLLSIDKGRELARTQNDEKKTALDLAIEEKNLAAVCLLLDADGSDVLKDDEQKEAIKEWLDKSSEFSSYFLFKALQQVGLNWDDRPIDEADKKGNTLLHQAVMEGDTEVVSYLLLRGAETNILNNEGKLPLDLVMEGADEIAELFESLAKESFSIESSLISSTSTKTSTTTSSSASPSSASP